jgi:RHH-type proline utilization regulon transcriptional repressor/proline dehydrogenase/delta 1-pyrroline-5-carboxylate dehydrogenase
LVDPSFDPTRFPAGAAAPLESASLMEPFLGLAAEVQAHTALRTAITAAYRRPETDCLPALIAEATLPPNVAAAAQDLARALAAKLRGKRNRSIVEALLQEYALSSHEGVALMCLAEALLRIPDTATRDALIRDKVGTGNWQSHLGGSRSLFVNAATWGLLLSGRLTATNNENRLTSALARLTARGGEPVVRAAVKVAMRLLGEQFVLGQTINEALANSRKWEAKGFRYSYDMLGEAALTGTDAARHLRDYEQAIGAIGTAAQHRGIYEGPSISIKLSALHPRYARTQRHRVMTELLARLVRLAHLARDYDIGLTIDAEEADRLELSLDLLESLCFDPALAGWNGIGFVVQAYQKRAPFVLDFLIDLAHRSQRRLMVRLVKGAYWDSEIKRAQLDGLEGFPVFTRKVHTDVCYLACASKLLAARDAIFPQFATHNAQTLAAIHAMAGEAFHLRQYEFQCLHGMGEPLYEEVVGPANLGRPCRIYAPVGSHETLLAYLVRRLLENGANTSFVNKINDERLSLDEIIADPVAVARQIEPPGAPHEKIALPRALFGRERENSAGFDLSNEQRLATLAAAGRAGVAVAWRAQPLLATGAVEGPARPVLSPSDPRDLVGMVTEADPSLVAVTFSLALQAAPAWRATRVIDRAAILRRAASALEDRLPTLVGLIVREAGKTLPAATGEVREAVDFLRYYAARILADFDDGVQPLGPVVAISPWNFPLAIFTGQVAAALAAGNVVLAKPAEETPLIAATAVNILHEAGVPRGALQLLPGDGRVGATLVADARVRGVLFTGSTEVARLIQAQLAYRLDEQGLPIPLIAETGGQNAMVVDSSALPEQVVTDIVASAFDSAGQRCSALRILLIQEEIAPRLLEMLKGVLAELNVGRPDRLSTDIGPVISAEARRAILDHVEAMRVRGYAVTAGTLPKDTAAGYFIAPTVIEIPSIDVLGREVFGPVLHVVRYKRDRLEATIDAVNALGYGLTFGIHSRIDETITRVTARISAGNIYVNRNIIGAVVGVQAFGGHALSGTGPKAGGPLYLRRLVAPDSAPTSLPTGEPPVTLTETIAALRAQGVETSAMERYATRSPLLRNVRLAGPVGEQNEYMLSPRGQVLCHAETREGLLRQLGAALATGNVALLAGPAATALLALLPSTFCRHIRAAGKAARPDVALHDGDATSLLAFQQELARLTHALVPVYSLRHGAAGAADNYPLELLLSERSISVNTAAAGGNASLMTIG